MSTSTAVHGASKREVVFHSVMDIHGCALEQVAVCTCTHVYTEAEVYIFGVVVLHNTTKMCMLRIASVKDVTFGT